MLDPTVRRIVDGTPIAHLATLLPDGSPHSIPVWVGTLDENIIFLTGPNSLKARNLRRDSRVALSISPPDNPFEPLSIRGRVVRWIDGNGGWELVDRVALKYTGSPYSRDVDRVIGVIEPERQIVGVR